VEWRDKGRKEKNEIRFGHDAFEELRAPSVEVGKVAGCSSLQENQLCSLTLSRCLGLPTSGFIRSTEEVCIRLGIRDGRGMLVNGYNQGQTNRQADTLKPSTAMP
jgi:hypothetical protein